MTYLQEHVCVTLAQERVLYLDGVKVPKNTRLGYKVCVKKSKARFDLEKKTPSTKCSNVKVSHQKVIYCLA